MKKFEQLLELEYQHFQPMSEEEYQSHVQEGLEDYKSGCVTSDEGFQKEMKTLLDSLIQVEIPDQVGDHVKDAGSSFPA